jgi:preprotein translocase subunit SecG
MLDTINKKKGVAGLNVLLSVVSILFIIGILVMVFVLAGNNLSDSIGDTTNASVNNETLTLSNGTAVATSVASLRSVNLVTISMWNASSGELVVEDGNWSETGGSFTALGTNTEYIDPTQVSVNFTYTYLEDTAATSVIVDTTDALGDTIDWFSTFIVMASLVVLVLLVVIIINSIKSAGLGA